MADPNRVLLEEAVTLLAPLLGELVFLGGCATGLLITDQGADGLRVTNDVDAIVDVANYAQYTLLADRLRGLGLVEDTSPDAPLCRWRHQRLIVDIMPTDEAVLGFSNRWYPAALASAARVAVAGHTIRAITPAHFVATKLEAFHGRGAGDIAASHDLEDIVAVVDGRDELVSELQAADEDVRRYVANEFDQLLRDPDFTDALSGFLLPDPATQARRAGLERKLRQITALAV